MAITGGKTLSPNDKLKVIYVFLISFILIQFANFFIWAPFCLKAIILLSGVFQKEAMLVILMGPSAYSSSARWCRYFFA